MILTDREIKISLAERLFEVTPSPDPSSFSSSSLDLRLDRNIRTYGDPLGGVVQTIDPANGTFSFNRVIDALTQALSIDPTNGYDLPPRSLILGWTIEEVRLKPTSRVAARVEGKSSLARLGLAVHVTAPTIHAGFVGQIQLEIINHGPLPIRLRTGMKICQLIFEQTLGIPEKGYTGQFSGQVSNN